MVGKEALEKYGLIEAAIGVLQDKVHLPVMLEN